MPIVTDTFDRPIRDLRISVTDRCNFRCPYCMPAEIFGERYQFLPRPEILGFGEILHLTRLFAELGVEKVRITGGEPLLRAELPILLASLAALDGVQDLALTTNGYLLGRMAPELSAAGLSRVTVSLDSLDPAVFKTMSGGAHEPDVVLDAIDAAAAAGLGPIKINCVVHGPSNADGLVDLARRFRGTGHIVRFIEYMDVGTLNGWQLSEVVSADEILDRLGSVFPLEPVESSYPGEVAQRYRYTDGSGEIGIIPSVTKPFCGDCTRARLTTDGRLVTCLFAETGIDLKTPLRDGCSDAELIRIIAGTWAARDDRYSELRTAATKAKKSDADGRIEMYQVGG